MQRFNVDGILHRRDGNKLVVFWVRSYARIETAVRRCTEYLILEGQVGDVIEFVLKINGMQVGTIKMSASGKMSVVWNDTEAKRLKSEQILARAEETTMPNSDLVVRAMIAAGGSAKKKTGGGQESVH